jgi:hypothetical protein
MLGSLSCQNNKSDTQIAERPADLPHRIRFDNEDSLSDEKEQLHLGIDSWHE